VTVTGKLGDGTKLTWKTSLVSIDDELRLIPFFSEPTTGGAIAAALVENDPEAGSDFLGVARWIRQTGKVNKPYALGFNGQVQVVIGKYTPPLAKLPVLDFGTGKVGLEGVPTGGNFSLTANKVAVAAPLKALSFNRANGLFSGKFLRDGKSVSFSGAVNQTLKAGVGQFLDSGETKAVSLVERLEATGFVKTGAGTLQLAGTSVYGGEVASEAMGLLRLW
jgi:autotransporter-associated beta strand protein